MPPATPHSFSFNNRAYPNEVDGYDDQSNDNSYSLGRGGLIALIIAVVAVAIIGATTATLFFIAKKREWTMRETIRKSARKVKTALTPRRSEFPSSVKGGHVLGRKSRNGHIRMAENIPPTPRIKADKPRPSASSEQVGAEK